MILFYGSNTAVKKPELHFSRSSLDFGAGFYTTTDKLQAEKWAHRTTRIRQEGQPCLSVFETDDSIWSRLSILRFSAADSDWLENVVKFRRRQNYEAAEFSGWQVFDVIAGPVADYRTADVINQYIAGFFDAEIALKLLLPMKLKDQLAFKTDFAITALVWQETILL
jgi:hypothetical protein